MTEPQITAGTYVDRVLDIMAAGGDRPALIHGDQRLSCAESGAMILKLAAALQSTGVRKGDSIALVTGNSPHGVLTGLAVHLLGCRLVFTPPDAAASERETFLRRAETAAFVFDPRSGSADRVRDLAPARVLSLGPADNSVDLLALAAGLPATRPGVRAGREDVSTVFHTGGTTGRPKMVLHSHAYYDALVLWSDRRYFKFPEPLRFLVVTPVSHTSGHLATVVNLLAGGTVVLKNGFDAAGVIGLIQSEGITSTMLLPAMLSELLDHPALPVGGLPTLKQLSYAGTSSSAGTIRAALRRFGPIIRQAYGLTEAHTVTVLTPEEHDESVPGRLGSCGRPLPGMVEVSIRDDSGEVPGGEIGEVCVLGPLVMVEYWKDPDLTKQVFRDGWLHTGDLGRLDENGYLHLVGRTDDVIITGRRSAGIYAANVYPDLLVDVLTAVPGVRMAAVIAAPDEFYGQAVHAVCVLDPGASVAAGELRKRAVEHLGPLYEPRTVTFVDSLPRTALGKLDKNALQRMVQSAASSGLDLPRTQEDRDIPDPSDP